MATLEYIVKKKYSPVLKLEDDVVMLQDNVGDILERGKDSRHKFSSSQRGPTISMNITINNVDQELCQHFLWDLAQKSIRDKFKFDFDGASNRLLGSQTTIEVDEFEAHHSIVKHAFDFLAHDAVEETKPIGAYLVPWLPYHLKQLQRLEMEDKGELSPVEKRDITDGLYNMFKSDDLFKRHKESFEGNWSYWYAKEMREINEWFMDSAAVRRLDKQWLREIKSASNPTRGYLRPLVHFLLTQLLRDEERTWNVLNAYRWIEQFILLVRCQGIPLCFNIHTNACSYRTISRVRRSKTILVSATMDLQDSTLIGGDNSASGVRTTSDFRKMNSTRCGMNGWAKLRRRCLFTATRATPSRSSTKKPPASRTPAGEATRGWARRSSDWGRS